MTQQHSKHSRAFWIGGSAVALFVALGIGQALLERSASAQAKNSVQAPRFEVDPLWPKPLPNHWILGSAIGVAVDADDHIWIIHRSSATLGNNEKPLETEDRASAARARRPCSNSIRPATCCATGAARARATSGPIRTTASSSTTRATSGSAATAGPTPQVLKFTKDGKFLMQVGKKGARRSATAAAGQGEGAQAGFAGGSNDEVSFGRVAKIFVDREGERGLPRRRLPQQARGRH